MKFYVLYKHYDELNQFEGYWGKDWQEFDSEKEAAEFIEQISNPKVSANFKDISGVLK